MRAATAATFASLPPRLTALWRWTTTRPAPVALAAALQPPWSRLRLPQRHDDDQAWRKSAAKGTKVLRRRDEHERVSRMQPERSAALLGDG